MATVMDLRTLVTVSTLLWLRDAASATNVTQPAATETPPSALTKRPDPTCVCTGAPATGPAAPAPTTAASAPHLGLLTVRWSSCFGQVKLIDLQQSGSLTDVCWHSQAEVTDVLGKVCEGRSGCGGPTIWNKGQQTTDGYNIRMGSAEKSSSCDTLTVKCSVVPNVEGQLQAYKVVTALLCCVLLVLLMIRFTRPTINALQRRLSDRRQNRWIGPTQSHSVSYNRGKNTVKNNAPEKRVSYPGLERLTVVSSREPSSSRNSYNF